MREIHVDNEFARSHALAKWCSSNKGAPQEDEELVFTGGHFFCSIMLAITVRSAVATTMALQLPTQNSWMDTVCGRLHFTTKCASDKLIFEQNTLTLSTKKT